MLHYFVSNKLTALMEKYMYLNAVGNLILMINLYGFRGFLIIYYPLNYGA